jgi:hypothetical protein
VSPVRSAYVPGTIGVRVEASTEAAVVAVWARSETASDMCSVPVKEPGGNPVIDEPGSRPTSPLMVVDPVFVTVVAPSTAKDVALLRFTAAVAAIAEGVANAAKVRKAMPVTTRTLKERRRPRGDLLRRKRRVGVVDLREWCCEDPAVVDIVSFPKIAMVHQWE